MNGSSDTKRLKDSGKNAVDHTFIWIELGEYLAHEETDTLIETTFNSARRVVLAERVRELEEKKEDSLYHLRVRLVGEERVRVRDLEIEQATLDFSVSTPLYLEDLEEDENADIPDYVIWE